MIRKTRPHWPFPLSLAFKRDDPPPEAKQAKVVKAKRPKPFKQPYDALDVPDAPI